MKHMQKILSLSLAAMLALSAPLALAESSSAQTNAEQTTQAPPDLPSGRMPGGPGGPGNGQQPPEKPDGDFGGGPGGPGNAFGGPGMGGSSAPSEYQAAYTLTKSADGQTYESTQGDENAVLVQEGSVTISNATVNKTGSSDGENADFYGINAAILATGGTLTVKDTTVTTDGAHANGIFSCGSGTTVNVSDTVITTAGNNSGGLMTTGGAALNAVNVTVSTAGNSSAAIRSDRGGGTVTVTGGTYETTGRGSPAIYSTADITVSDAALSAADSEAVVIEGGNSITLNNVTISGNDAHLNGQSSVKTNALIYQSMSGDAKDGNSSFTMNGGSMTALTGDMLHVTNVTTAITLSQVDFTYAEDSRVFLSASADAWGNSGKNGGHVTLTLVDQAIEGDLTADQDSSLNVIISAGSSLLGAVNPGNASQDVSLTLDAASVWTLTADSYLTAFSGDMSQVNLNGYTLYVNGEAQ